MTSRSKMVFITTIIMIIILVSASFIDRNRLTVASDQPSTDVSLGVDKNQEIVVKFYYDSQQQLNAVAGELDVLEVHATPWMGQGAGYALAAVYPSQQDWLQVQGYRVEIDQEHTQLLQAPTATLDPRFYYFDSNNPNPNGLYMVDFLQETNTAYPGLTELIDIGDAWAAGHGGPVRDMWVLRITNEDSAYGDIANKPPFFLMANIHAREVTTPEMAIRYIKYLTSGYLGTGGYDIDPDVTWLVNHHVTYVLVSQNPDGHVVNEIDWYEYWRKNVDNDDGCSTGSFGVDLNRNHSFFWGCCGGSSGSCSAETYRGPAPASEPETAALQAYAMQVFTDWNGDNGDNELPPAAPDDTAGLFISLHSYQDEILWAYEHSNSGGGAPNDAGLSTIGHKLGAINTLIPTGFLYTVDGGTIDWIYGHFGIPGYTFEIGPTWGTCGDFFPSYDCMEGLNGAPENFWAEMRPSFIYADKIARTPYVTSYGPDALNITVDPSSAPSGLPVNLTATIKDQRYSGDPLTPVAAAEYFIDTEGVDGTGIAMNPSDGAWGETTEPVEVVIDTSGLTAGKHYILVHGMSNQGDWGPFTAVFLTITAPDAPIAGFSTNSPVELGQPIVFTNETTGLEPLTYLWDFGDGSGTSTDKNPSYTYNNVGSYTVIMTATNEIGSDAISHQVEVIPPSIASITLTEITPDPVHPGVMVTFSTDLLPDNAGKPYSYIINFGDGNEENGSSSEDPLLIPHSYAQTGTYTVQIQVKNDSMLDPITASIEVNVVENMFRVYLPLALSR